MTCSTGKCTYQSTHTRSGADSEDEDISVAVTAEATAGQDYLGDPANLVLPGFQVSIFDRSKKELL